MRPWLLLLTLAACGDQTPAPVAQVVWTSAAGDTLGRWLTRSRYPVYRLHIGFVDTSGVLVAFVPAATDRVVVVAVPRER